jgi:MFS family permease
VAAFVALGAFWGAWAALLPEVQRRTGASDGQLGLALAGAGVVALPAMLLTGRAVDRFAGRVLPVALVVLGVGGVLPGLARSPLSLAMLVLPIGGASGAVDVAMNTGVVAHEAGPSSPRLMHRAHAVYSATHLVAALLTGVARHFGATPLPVLTAAAVVAVAAASLNRRVAPGRAPRPPAASLRLRPTNALVLLGALCALAFLLEGAMEAWSAIHLETTLRASPLVGSMGPATLSLAMVVGRLAGHLRAHRATDAGLLAATGLACAVGVVVTAAAPDPVAALVGIAVCGLGIAVAAPTIFTATGNAADPAQHGSALAMVTTVGYLGFLFAPLLVGGISEHLGLRTGLGGLAGVALLLAAGGRLLAPLSSPA